MSLFPRVVEYSSIVQVGAIDHVGRIMVINNLPGNNRIDGAITVRRALNAMKIARQDRQAHGNLISWKQGTGTRFYSSTFGGKDREV